MVKFGILKSKIENVLLESYSKKGLSESYSREYINECITLYENVVNKIMPADIKKLNMWVKNTQSNNSYENIDNLFSTDVLTIESRIKSKNLISENLKKLPITKTKGIDLPLSTMVSVANKTIKNFIDTLSESDKAEIVKLLSEDDSTLTLKFNTLKENVVDKLKAMKNSSEDNSVKSRVEETLTKVISEKYDKLTYFKLKSLNENL
jgi:hypothetical protein